MLRELWILIKLLFSSKPSDINEVVMLGTNNPKLTAIIQRYTGKIGKKKDKAAPAAVGEGGTADD